MRRANKEEAGAKSGAGLPLRNAVAAFAVQQHCPVDGRYLVGVSGGRDSMVLLHALFQAGYRRLIVCHLDHQLRGRTAQADARFVQKHAERSGLTVVVARTDVRALAQERKVSLETAAREARRSFFFQVARARRCRDLFLAHHADDQVETVLFNLCRGTGATGLGGMLPVGEWRMSAARGKGPVAIRTLRPLLGVWRQEVDAYAREHKVAFREDGSNTDPAHTRNRVRHEILPALDDVFGRKVGPGIWRAADIVGAEEAWLREGLAARLEEVAASVELPWKPLTVSPVAEQRRLLRAWLLARGASGIGYEQIELTRTLLDPVNGPAKINLPRGLCVRRRAGFLFVEAMDARTHRATASFPR